MLLLILIYSTLRLYLIENRHLHRTETHGLGAWQIYHTGPHFHDASLNIHSDIPCHKGAKIDIHRLADAIIVQLMRLKEMVVEVTLRRKRFRTPFSRAMVWFFSRMQAQVCLQVSLLVEGLATVLKWTYEVSGPVVLLQMHLESLLATVGFIAALHGA